MQVNNVEELFEKTLQESELTKKQQAVLSVSLNLFAEQGFDRTSTSEIAKQAGVSEGTVFKQFKTKDGILKALLDPMIEQVVPMAASEFLTEINTSQISDFEGFLTYAIKDRMVFALANRKQLKVFVQEIIRKPEITQGIADKLQRLIAGPMGDLLHQFQVNGQLVDWPVMRIARYIVGTLASYVVPQILMGIDANLDVEQASRDAAHFLVRGLAPEK
ncbi:helix-turn-helix domain-containing protein [Lactiplantibacillus sp. WILCCON 0030]|uniref:Helix-turn-helix domain-containing protein n=1 Tax=Lactiplantibacillus brownii TaxID=3069269 RepID=A0ABU1AD32_9LACO|nr:helix-turn-helix domain-containing protein [Lactiplantibacillus brownii]MDQ7938283.1 helix-turn-helix domain-containing protein [Lactiplantibacillus brownii]